MATIAGFTVESTIKQLDGKTVVSGYTNTLVGGYDFAIARYHENGILDNSFSGDGKTTTDFFKSIDKAYSVIQQFDGKLVVAGYAYNNKIPPDSDFAVSRYNSDGTLDFGFSGDGKLTTDFFGSYDEGYSVIQQFDGKLVVAGYAYNKNGSRDFALARYKTDGTLDASFSGDGKVTTDFGSTIDGAQSIIQQDDGKLLVAGYSGIGNPVNWIFAIARYKTDGSLDTSFSNSGKLTANFGSYGKYSITQESDGKLTVKGDGTLLAQYTPNGLLYYAPTGNVTISGTTTQGQILTAAHTLADVDGLGTVTYQWKANGSIITGATGTTYTLGQADVGKTISVTASYTDGQGTAEAVTSAATTAVANVNDAPTGTVTLTGTATEGQTLTAVNTLADVDGLGIVTYQWKANGSAITGATGSTYTLDQADVGKTISVTASYTDGQGTVEAVTSAATAVVTSTVNTITGNSSNNVLLSTVGDDVIDGGAGIDTVSYANATAAVNVTLASNAEQNTGGAGIDTLLNIENLTGSKYNDTLTGNAGANVLNGGTGADTMTGGNGNDTYYVNHASDVVNEVLAGGTDTVFSTLLAYTLRANVEKGVVQGTVAGNLTGNALANTLTGNAAANRLNGDAGNDTLKGNGGNDILTGGAGKDALTGGAGNDVFKFNTLAESGLTATTRDVITDFVRGQDKIDLSTIDANTALVGNQAFTGLIGANVAFTKAGQLRLNAGVLYGNTDADAAAEFSIALTGITTLANTDFVL